MKKVFILVIIPFLLIAKPVKVDEILTEKKSFKLDTSISYSNINRKDSSIYPLQYQTQNGDFVTIPTYLGENQSNQDYINYAFSIRYGLSKDFEFFSSINFYTSDTHISGNGMFDTKSEKGFNSLSLGLTYQVKKEDEKPSLLIGTSATMIERVKFTNSDKNSYFKRYNFFATSFYTVDPIVFLVKASYGLNLKTKDDNSTIDRGEIFVLTPEIYFAVNPYTSISWGIKYSYYDKDKIDGSIVSNSGSRVSYIFGVSYEIDKKLILNIDTDFSSSVSILQNSITFSLSYKF